ncbi:sigma-54-dependent transcriptional regulator [Desulforamulus hydrothermalis]|uniref:DNA-binding transcriptional regulator NtrC n=1 Tax=Desulforamulus hydrothermalis Lam5 = DSM 18033 TaxID=1121428 RepID=K8EFL6_9FIRM|nr:sigma-54 dependent transcriptional regulator [Desulforamulus hydrothermalis]CCO07481.1 putative DNA-binding response regulator in two-component system [Desulforamulus hydrothermalis Lam5 = DSM 18033]SHH17519.1 two-component system, NtrC family, response regulator AtoC [Desulforamulus hydrothermalis Lam5 = DSM 18033]
MSSKLVLVVDDEESVRQFLYDVLTDAAYRVETAVDGQECLDKLVKLKPDVLVTDIRMPEKDGLSLLEQIKSLGITTPVILMTAFGTTEVAIKAMKLGAFDYIVKPFDLDELLNLVQRAAEQTETVAAFRPHDQAAEPGVVNLIGNSPAMQAVYKDIGRVADSNATVLIQGESGTGKELVARAIHNNSSRRHKPFIKINCANLPDSLLESELFGYEKGAFTGAGASKVGKFELAHEGTIFFDEIGEISLATQAKLLRAIQEKEFDRVGGTATIKVDVRILAATNRKLKQSVLEGDFREDLFFRLNVVNIVIPPLRERKEDIPLLVAHFLAKYNKEFNRQVKGFSTAATQMLMAYDWPGNVRELENVVERAVIMARGSVIVPEDIALAGRQEKTDVVQANRSNLSLKQIVADVERQTILQALTENNWCRTTAARVLGINRRTLYAKMKELGIEGGQKIPNGE